MRRIKVPLKAVQMAANPQVAMASGKYVVVPVQVDWPKLRLTEEQMVANAVALMDGEPQPYPDPSIFDVELPVVPLPAGEVEPI